jgi:hypothetical protein
VGEGVKVLAKKMGRRLFSRGSLMAPVALATQNDGGFIGRPESGSPLIGGIGGSDAVRMKVWETLRKERRKDEFRENRRHVQRYLCGGIDPDIACLQSLPYSTQVRMQADRQEADERKRRGLIARIAIMFGADPDEF